MRLLTVIFICSGAAGLIYESIWSRYLGLFVGHSAYAQVIVLVIFLGGMSVGAFIAGERSIRVKRPLRWYAYIELAAGALGLAFHFLYVQITTLTYDHLFPVLAGGTAVPVVKWALSGLMILPQSILLGATFPLMSAAAIRFFPMRPGRDLSLLYFGNSLGAAIGVLLAGFVLLRLGGLPGTLLTAAVINVGVFFAAMAAERRLTRLTAAETPPSAAATTEPPRLSQSARSSKKKRRAAARRGEPARPVPRVTGERWGSRMVTRFFMEPPATDPGTRPPLAIVAPAPAFRPRLTRALLAVSFGTAVASFIYEIAWIRMLSLVLGSTTHSFELMLSAFILGLALGAFAIRTWVDRIKRPVFVLGVIQWIMGLFALATLPIYAGSFEWLGTLQDAFVTRTRGYEMYGLLRYGLCLAVMLPATICAGMTLPLITRTLFVAGAGERAIGRVYAVNTLGSIIGVMLAALVLMPLLGLKFLLAVGALMDMAIGALLLWPVVRRRFVRPVEHVLMAAAGCLLFVVGTLRVVRLDQTMLTSGVFRYGAAAARAQATILYYRDGRTATVSVRHSPRSDMVTLNTNGKPDASIMRAWLQPRPGDPPLTLAGDNGTQILLPIVTLAHAPDARNAAIIGQGSGVSSHFLLGSPHLEEVVTVEIEPEIIRASRLFYPFNRRVFDDPRSVFVVDDAKSYFAAANRQFDVIISEPSNPWVSGTSGLFTVEFYQRVKRHLAPGGVLGQWLHLYETTDEMVMSVVAALDKVFPDYEVFMVAPGDLLIVAATAPSLREPDWAVVNFPFIRDDFSTALVPSAAVFERLRLGGRDVLGPMLVGVTPNSDYRPVLELAAERARYTRARPWGFAGLAGRWFHIPAILEGRRLDFTADTISAIPGMARVDGAAFSARLRQARESGFSLDEELRRTRRNFTAAVDRLAVLERLADVGQRPASWRTWLEAFTEAERDLHFGSFGVADDRFYDTMIGYARDQGAPAELVLSLEFLRARNAWDFDTVIRLAPAIEATHRQRNPWISGEVLRDAVVVAHIVRGDLKRARESLAALTPLGSSTIGDYDFRTEMLSAAIRQLEATTAGSS